VPELHVLRVFTTPDGSGGNPLGVFLDGPAIDPGERQRIAADLGFSETVFVDDPARGEMRIFTPATELGFAGHPTVGTAWLLRRERAPVEALRPPAGEVAVRYDGDDAYVAARPEWARAGTPYEFFELGSPGEVDALTAAPEGHEMAVAWAWEDEAGGRVRSRVFPGAIGIAEDEATGGAAVIMGDLLGRAFDIRQGRGSIIHVRPLGDGWIEIGGGVALDEVRGYEPGGSGGGTPSK
jgi:predicted PhzF superfamily epimerase YddE/YHI9